MGENDKEYSMAEFEALLDSIKRITELTEREIATKAGYKDPNYLAQVRSKGKVSPRLMDALQLKFARELEKTNWRGEKSSQDSNKTLTGRVRERVDITDHSDATLIKRDLIIEYVDSLNARIKELESQAGIPSRLDSIEERLTKIAAHNERKENLAETARGNLALKLEELGNILAQHTQLYNDLSKLVKESMKSKAKR